MVIGQLMPGKNRYFAFGVLLALPAVAMAAQEDAHGAMASLALLAMVLLLGKLSSLVERFGQPAVLGELLMGLVLGNLHLLGIDWFEALRGDEHLAFMAELGVIVLLFQIGLESNMSAMRQVGSRAFLVALLGIVIPFALGVWVVGPVFFPEMSFNTHLFFGAALTATSVGITARVFQDMAVLARPEAQIVLGAAVIDDVLGLIILAVVSAVVTTGSVSVLGITVIAGKALLFLAVALLLGQRFALRIGWFFSRIHTGVGMKFTIAVCFGLFMAYLAQWIGLAAIVGAFAAGLVLDEVVFRRYDDPAMVRDIRRTLQAAPEALRLRLERIMEYHSSRHLEGLLLPVGHLTIPVFFVLTGFQVDLAALADPHVVLTALAVTLVAILGKMAAGLVAGPVNRWLVGVGMVPRGEVGLIFASVGQRLGVIDGASFAVIVIMVMGTTLVTPPALSWLLRRA
jgi:Kef-type K+ transport system membrane component KefB